VLQDKLANTTMLFQCRCYVLAEHKRIPKITQSKLYKELTFVAMLLSASKLDCMRSSTLCVA